MITMTYNEAVKIQAEQIKYYYRDENGPLMQAGIDELRRRTLPCPFDPNEMVPIRIINGLVPRGGDIEKIMGIDMGIDGGGG